VTGDAPFAFGGDGEPRAAVEGAGAMSECAERLFLACRQSVLVRAWRLDLDFYFSQSFTESCQSIVTRDLRNEILFMVEDERFVMQVNTRLVSLGRRFSSYVKVKVIPEEYIEHQEMFIVVDGSAWMHQYSLEQDRALMSLSDRGNAGRLARRFRDLWDRSEPPAEMFTTGL